MGDWLVAGGSRKKSTSRTSKEDAARTQHTELVRNFKTSLCTIDHGEDRVAARRCPGIHAWEDTSLVQRRPPFQPPYYDAEICPDRKWCDRGPQCPFAHSQFEVLFHPMRCRHGMCRDREACRRVPQCAFAHSEVEQTLAQITATDWLGEKAQSGCNKVGAGAGPSSRSLAAFVESALPQLEPHPAVPSSSRVQPASRVPEATFEFRFEPWQSDLLHGARGKKLQDEIQRRCAHGSVALTATFTTGLPGWQLTLGGSAGDEFDTHVAACLQRIDSVWWSKKLLPRSERPYPPRFIRFLSQPDGLHQLQGIRKKWMLDGALVMPGGEHQYSQTGPHTVVLWSMSEKARSNALHDLDLLLASHKHSAECEHYDAQLQAAQQELSRLRAEYEGLAEKHDELQIEHEATSAEYVALQLRYSKLDSEFVVSTQTTSRATIPATASVAQRRRNHQHWDEDACPTDQRCALIPLDERGEEFDSVHVHFLASFGSARVLVKQIVRVQNRDLFDLYILKKSQMTQPNEKWLFHGSDPAAVQSMCENSFNRSYAGKHAIAYGKGCYFALNSKYSNEYASRDQRGARRMIVAWVAVGKHCPGDRTMCAPEQGYDTTSNHQHHTPPSIFVTYNDAQSYPAYVITYRTEFD